VRRNNKQESAATTLLGYPSYGSQLSAFLLFALLQGACTLKPEELSRAGSLGPVLSAPAQASDINVGPPKVDEFNDQASGTEVPAKGGQLIVQFVSEPDSLNPFTDNSAVNSYIAEYVFSSLLRQNPSTFEWEGNLAERWLQEDTVIKQTGEVLRGKVSFSGPQETGDINLQTASSAGQRISRAAVKEVHAGASFTFYLRPDARFHDGRPVTAADVKFTFDVLKNKYVDAASLQAYYVDVESAEVLDSHTVRITYGKQYWDAISYAGGSNFTILPRHIYDPDNLIEKDPEQFGKHFNEGAHNRKPVGSGPYKFEKWDTGLQVSLARNDDYWDSKRAGHLDRIIFKFISDPVAALQALKNGEIDFLTRARAEQFVVETKDPEFLKRFVKVPYYTPNFSYIGWNMRHPPFDDARVRQAMAYGALDVQDFLEKIRYGLGIRVSAYQYFFGPAYDHSLQPFPFDQNRARELLLDAGWFDRDGDGLRDKNGQPFRFEFLQPSGSDNRLAALLKENLRKLGIDMVVRELEFATLLQNIYDRQFEACVLAWAQDPESDPYQIWHTSQKENRGSNHVGFGDAFTDQLIEQSRMTMDAGKRREIFHQFDRILYEQQPYLFLYTAPDLGMYDKRFRGVRWYKLRPGYDFTEWFIPREGVR
jgi:peptide/nickel transport system substrate-binding protein